MVFRPEWPPVSSASFATASRPRQSLSTSVRAFAWLSKPCGKPYFFTWSEQGVTPAFFKKLFQFLSTVKLYGMWAGALMVQNTSAHQEASASLWVCPSVSIENNSFTVFYTSLVFSTSCSTAYSFRLCKMLWRCLFQREFCLKSRRTLQAVRYVLPLVWKIIWILYFSA